MPVNVDGSSFSDEVGLRDGVLLEVGLELGDLGSGKFSYKERWIRSGWEGR